MTKQNGLEYIKHYNDTLAMFESIGGQTFNTAPRRDEDLTEDDQFDMKKLMNVEIADADDKQVQLPNLRAQEDLDESTGRAVLNTFADLLEKSPSEDFSENHLTPYVTRIKADLGLYGIEDGTMEDFIRSAIQRATEVQNSQIQTSEPTEPSIPSDEIVNAIPTATEPDLSVEPFNGEEIPSSEPALDVPSIETEIDVPSVETELSVEPTDLPVEPELEVEPTDLPVEPELETEPTDEPIDLDKTDDDLKDPTEDDLKEDEDEEKDEELKGKLEAIKAKIASKSLVESQESQIKAKLESIAERYNETVRKNELKAKLESIASEYKAKKAIMESAQPKVDEVEAKLEAIVEKNVKEAEVDAMLESIAQSYFESVIAEQSEKQKEIELNAKLESLIESIKK